VTAVLRACTRQMVIKDANCTPFFSPVHMEARVSDAETDGGVDQGRLAPPPRP